MKTEAPSSQPTDDSGRVPTLGAPTAAPVRARRPAGRVLLLGMFSWLAINGFQQAFDIVRGKNEAPMALFWLHLGAGLLAAGSVLGVWRRARWTTYAIAGWGIESAVIVVLLRPLLSLPAESREGLWYGAAVALAIASLAAWYERRSRGRMA